MYQNSSQASAAAARQATITRGIWTTANTKKKSIKIKRGGWGGFDLKIARTPHRKILERWSSGGRRPHRQHGTSGGRGAARRAQARNTKGRRAQWNPRLDLQMTFFGGFRRKRPDAQNLPGLDFVL